MPVFPSVEWFEAVSRSFNSNEANRTAGGGIADADVGIIFDDQMFLLNFAGYECEKASVIGRSDLENLLELASFLIDQLFKLTIDLQREVFLVFDIIDRNNDGCSSAVIRENIADIEGV